MFRRRKKAARTCPQGHAMEESWQQCPFCAAESADAAEPVGRESNGERLADPGDGAVVVPRKTTGVRRLAGWLVVTDGEDTDRDFRLHAGPNVLGKSADCDVVIKDAYASQRHAVVHCRDGEYTVEDLESKHGTLVNDEQLRASRPLRDGERIRVGNTELRFRSFG